MEINNIKLSIIIPYYETYELTRKLLISLIAQLPFEAEIILIDDGCNEKRFDEYLEFLNNFGFNYLKQVKIIHQKNQGVSYSRNLGIDLAQGEYIAFIDSDDMVMSNYVETLLKLINNRPEDIIYFNWLDINTNDVVVHPGNPAVWKAIYKKETMPHFKEDMQYGHEDVLFQGEIDSGKYSIAYLDKLLYFYNSNRVGSLIWKKTHKEE